MGRIQPIRLWRPCVMHLCVPNNVGKAVQTDPTLLHYASAITEQIKMSRSCWLKSLTGFKLAQQLPTTRNNLQQGVQADAHSVKSNNVGSCRPTMLHVFAWGFKGIKSNKNDVILCRSMHWYDRIMIMNKGRYCLFYTHVEWHSQLPVIHNQGEVE